MTPKKQQLYNPAYWLSVAGIQLLPEQQISPAQQVAFQRFLESIQYTSSGLSKEDFEAQLQLIHPDLWDRLLNEKYLLVNHTGQYLISPVYFQSALQFQYKSQKKRTNKNVFIAAMGAFWAAICLAVVYTQYNQPEVVEPMYDIVQNTGNGQFKNYNQRPVVLQTSWEGLEVQREIASALFDAPNDRNQTLERLITEYEGKMEKMPFRAWVALATLYELQNDTEKQLFAYDEVLQQDSTYLPAYCGRARAHILLGDFDAAVTDYNHVLARDNGSQEAYEGLARIRQMQGNNQDALSMYSTALKKDPKNDKIWIQRAVIYTEMEEYDKAIKDYSKALQLNPNRPSIWMDRGALYEKIEAYPKAAADYKQAVMLEPTHSDWHQKRYQVIEKMQAMPEISEDEVATAMTIPTLPNTNLEDIMDSSTPSSGDNRNLLPMQQLHPTLRTLAWVLGKWEVELEEGKEPVWEEWRVKNRNKISGVQYNTDHTIERRFWVEYDENTQNALLYMTFSNQEDYYTFKLSSTDNNQVIFTQNTVITIPSKVIFERNTLGAGYTVSIVAGGDKRLTEAQADHLDHAYQVDFRKAICSVKPSTKSGE